MLSDLTGRTFLGILHTASGAEAAFAAEGNKFHVVASGADIHGIAKRRIARNALPVWPLSLLTAHIVIVFSQSMRNFVISSWKTVLF